MSKRTLALLCLLVLALATPAFAAPPDPLNSPNYAKDATSVDAALSTAVKDAIGPNPFPGIPFPILDPAVQWREQWICRSAGPAEVQGFRIICGAGTFVDFHISDCCVPGDHWQLKGKEWDAAPNTGVTTSPGGVIVYSVPGRVYNYGGTPFNPGLDVYVECTYQHGVNLFLADSFVVFSSDAAGCFVIPDPVRQRIDRTP